MKDLITRFRAIHGDKYDYSRVEYRRMIDKVEIICPIHGSFFQEPHNHLKGYGCKLCGIESRKIKKMDTNESFIEKANKIHNGIYGYENTVYVQSQEKVCITCQKHGDFWQRPNDHLQGKGCPMCYNEKRGNNLRMTEEEFVRRAKEVHGSRYAYTELSYKNIDSKVDIICPIHGKFSQNAYSHLIGKKCPECAKIERGLKHRMTTEEFIKKAKEIHDSKYDYSETIYTKSNDYLKIRCPKHGIFTQIASYHLSGNGCQECANELTDSASEREIFDFIKLNYNGIAMHNYRGLLNDKKELDIYLPSLKIAFEFDGLYWHNEKNQPSRSYHLHKTKECLEKGIQLIHIFEDEWIYKKDIVKSRILNLLGKSENKIYARKCSIKEVDSKTSREFLNENHIQGYCNSSIRYGLYYEGMLVSLMTFGGKRKNLGSNNIEGHFELLRFCNKLNTNVIGGASKLFKYFIDKKKPQNVVSYADRRWSVGKLYEILGFTLSHESQPSYFYVINDKRENRFNYRKDVLVKEGYDPNKTEHQIMLDRGIYRIYDCGCLVYEYNISPTEN